MPPALSTAAIAAFEAPATSIVSGRPQLAFREQADTVAASPQHSRGDQGGAVERALGFELALVDRGLQAAQIHDLEIRPEHAVVEAALGQPAVQRRLAAFEAVERHAGARGLAFAAAPRSLAFARPDTAPDPFGPIMRSRIIPDLVELHRFDLPWLRLVA